MRSFIPSVRPGVTLLLAPILFFAGAAPGRALTPTTTSLTLSAASAPAKTGVTLTATVSPAIRGTVNFCNANATNCIGTNLYATVPTTTAGVAKIKQIFGAGVYSIKAVLVAGATTASSSSGAQTLTITGNANYLTETTVSTAGYPGNYTLTSLVAGSGFEIPTGNVSFVDTTSSSTAVASAALEPVTSVFGFTPFPSIPGAAYGAVTGDFNEDGIEDFVSLPDTSLLYVNLGNGDGTFHTPVSYAGVPFGAAGAAVDVNGDGHLDLIIFGIQNQSTFVSQVGVLLGNGDGTFQPVSSFASGHLGTGIAVADLNGDGYPDIATVNSSDNNLAIFLGKGDGTFQPKAAYTGSTSSSALYNLVIGDFNGDGKPDIVVATYAGLNLFLGNGDGTFPSTPTSTISAQAPIQVTSGDFNHDGKLDLAALNFANGGMSVLLGNGNGTFQTALEYGGAGSGTQITVGDFNGDGFQDIALNGLNANSNFYLGNGDGTFQSAGGVPDSGYNEGIVAVDLDGDGLDDLIVGTWNTSQAYHILIAQHTQTAIATGVAVPGPGTQQVTANYEGDAAHATSVSAAVPLMPQSSTTVLTASPVSSASGSPVTFTATITPTPGGAGTPGTVGFFAGATLLGTGNVTGNTATYTTSSLPGGYSSLTAIYAGNAVLNGSTSAVLNFFVGAQTALSLAVSSTSATVGSAVTLTASASLSPSGTVLTSGVVTFSYQGTINGVTSSASFGTVALNNAGTAALGINPGPGVFVVTATLAGQASLGPAVSTPQTITFSYSIAPTTVTSLTSTGSTGDYTLVSTVTGFGRAAPGGTIPFLDTSAANAVVATAALGAATGYTTVTALNSPLTAASNVQVATGDFNRDGYTDVATITSSGSVMVQLGLGGNTFQTAVSYTVRSGSLSSIVAADVNGDGATDLVVWSNGANRVYVLLGNGDGAFQTASGAQVLNPGFGGSSSNGLAVADMNNDGYPDILVLDNNFNYINVLLGNGNGTFQAVKHTIIPYNANDFAVGDFNGDGKADVAIDYAQYNNEVSLFPGLGTGFFSAGITLGLPRAEQTGHPAAGSLRGNGIIDLVVPDSASAHIFVYHGTGSGLGAASSLVINHTPNLVFLADLDHDGNLDMVATYASSLGFFHGNGDGTFGAEQDFATGNGVGNVVSGDFNNDGVLDLITSNTSDGTASVLLGELSTTATANAVYVTGTGSQLVDASYPGDAAHAASLSTTVPLSPSTQAASTTALTTSSAAIQSGASVTFTATINPVPTGAGLGTAGFLNNGVLVATEAVLSSGTSTFTTTALRAGTDSITAVYSGNSGLATSTSTPVVETVLTATTTTVTASSPSAQYGGSVTLTASVAPVPTGSSLGSATFYQGSTLLGTGTISAGGTASITLTTLPIGTDAVDAVYSGNALFSTSTSSTVSIAISTSTTTTTLTASNLTPASGQAVLLTAAVAPIPPTGTISFYNGSTLLGTQTVNAQGGATLSVTNLPVGVDAVTATFSGSSGYAASTSPAVSISVASSSNRATTTQLSASSLTPAAGQTVTFTANVVPVPANANRGSVGFYLGSSLLGTQALSVQGSATLSDANLPLGSNLVTAVYAGSDGYAGSTSAALSISVRAATTVTFNAAPTTQLNANPIALTAQVSSASAGSPTGTVSFLDGSTLVTTAQVNSSGQAAASVTTLADGPHSLTAAYSGDVNFLASESSGAAVAITVGDLNLALGGDKNKTVVPGAAVTYNFPLSPVVTPTFIYNVQLTATGLPPGATYTFSPSLIPAGSTSLPVAFTVQTAKQTGLNSLPANPSWTGSNGKWITLAAFGLMLPLGESFPPSPENVFKSCGSPDSGRAEPGIDRGTDWLRFRRLFGKGAGTNQLHHHHSRDERTTGSPEHGPTQL